MLPTNMVYDLQDFKQTCLYLLCLAIHTIAMKSQYLFIQTAIGFHILESVILLAPYNNYLQTCSSQSYAN